MAHVKYGKIGAPKSTKRKAWLRKMRSARSGIVLRKKGKKRLATFKGIVLKRKVSGAKRKRKKSSSGWLFG